jgi:DNA-binding NarL/FixJ family response regulator
MEQPKVKILWIDDDLDRLKLRPYLDRFEDANIEIIKVANPDDIDSAIAANSDIQCIIVDISMPTGEEIDVKESKQGMRTGLFVLKKLNANDNLKPIKKIVFTIVSDDEVSNYCKSNNIPCEKKQEYTSGTFVEYVKRATKNNS